MDFKAEPVGFKAEDGRRYDTEDEAIKMSMRWEMMKILMGLYKYRTQDVALEHAEQIFQLEDKGLLTVNWNRIEEELKSR